MTFSWVPLGVFALALSVIAAPHKVQAGSDSPLPLATALAWPSDIGTSHFGLMGYAGEAAPFEGVWARPHAGEAVWGNIERERGGQYRWGNLDAEVRAAQQQRVALLITIWPFAQWDQDICHGTEPAAPASFIRTTNRMYAPCDTVAYDSFVRAMVDRYNGDGLRDMQGLLYPVRHWEIGNEPELQGQSGSGGLTFFQGSSTSYLGVLQATASAIRGADPLAVVVSGGQAGMLPEHAAFWSPIVSSGSSAFDIANVHSIRASETFYTAEYRAFLDQRGLSARAFWVTEAQVGSPTDTTDDALARRTMSGYAGAFANGASVIFRVPGTAPNSGSYGPLAEGAFALLGRSIGTFTSATWEGANRVRFAMPNGSTVYVLWDGARLPQGTSGPVSVTTYLGQQSTPVATDVVASVPVMVLVTPSTRTTGGGYTGSIASTGVTLVSFTGPVSLLRTASVSARVSSVTTTTGGKTLTFVVGAPDFVNAEFLAAFPNGLANTFVVVKTG